MRVEICASSRGRPPEHTSTCTPEGHLTVTVTDGTAWFAATMLLG